jgi:hypothetical protein
MKHGHLSPVAAFFALLAGASSVGAQSSPSQSPPSSGTRIDVAMQAFEQDPRFKRLPLKKRQDLVKFVIGNTLFALVHEFGHTAISEMGLPVLGREEDAADAFAAVVGLKMDTAMSQGVLIEATKGWFYADRRDKREGNKMAFYDEHGIDKQRAYNVVCLMVGSDPEKFKSLADETKLPEERQASCVSDYSNASWSWETVLKPHRRAADQAKTKIDVSYQEGKGKLAVFATAFRDMRLLETIAERASDSFAWRAPFALEMQTCDESNAHWDISVRKIIVCYEIANEFAQLYLDYGEEREAADHN